MARSKQNLSVFISGIKDGIPIALGYLAVSFSLGITAKNAGLTAFQGFLVSFLCNASAGEYAGFTSIAASAPYIEIALATLIANARYFLMSCALSQRVAPDTRLGHRMLIAFDVTDELFAISVARPDHLEPIYFYGAMLVAIPGWAVGTMLGVIAGTLLPLRIVSAFSVALFGMFLAVIIPPARKDKIIAVLIVICFACSFAAAHLPVVSDLSEGTRTIILTLLISTLAAVFFPKKVEEGSE